MTDDEDRAWAVRDDLALAMVNKCALSSSFRSRFNKSGSDDDCMAVGRVSWSLRWSTNVQISVAGLQSANTSLSRGPCGTCQYVSALHYCQRE